MVIIEHISGIIEVYDYSQSAWVELAALSDANVLRASARKQCCPDGAITIGGVYAAALSLVCRLPGARYFDVKRSRITVCSQYGAEESPEQIGVFFALDVQRSGDIFTISAQDAVGWTDTSANNYKPNTDTGEPAIDLKYGIGAFMEYEQSHQPGQSYPANAYTNLQDWMRRLSAITSRLIQGQCGIPNLVQWENYDVTRNSGYDYANSHVFSGSSPDPSHEAAFPLYVKDNDVKNLQGSARTDSPRDYYRFLAELAAGFVYADEAGHLTLGQFGQVEWGIGNSTAEIHTQEIEADSLVIADYDIQPLNTLVRAESHNGWAQNSIWTTTPDYANHAYIRYEVTESNPFACGWHAVWTDVDLGTLARGLWWARCDYGGSMYTLRPFRCKVHKQTRFHLGQRIKIFFKDRGESSETQYDSIITSIVWTYRGGHQIACGGEDGRTMLDCLRGSKGDRVARDLRNTITAMQDRS